MEATQARAERFGGLLRLYRTRLALTQEGLAERAGVSTRSVRAAELGQTHPQRETAQRLADALQLDTTEREELLAAAAPAPRRTGTLAAFDTQAAESLPPAPPTRFIGRAAEMAQVLDLLRRPDAPLITLTGPGGVGKTRLAVEAAQAAHAFFAGGAIFVGLAALDTPQLLLATVANACGLRELGAQPILTSLANYLHNKKVLLLLDNFEHLAEAAPDLAALLRVLPHAKFLTTSRMPLHLQGEHLLSLEPLALPAAGTATTAAVGESEAVRLFVQRAGMVKPGFTLDAANAAAVAAITHHLDGLPLAIELAAARSAVLPPQALLQRLSHPLEVLTGGARDLPPRHQTLCSTIAWSYALLTPAEQALFRRLSVCAGGCLPSAAAVIGSDAAQQASAEANGDRVIETLLSLAEKNMLAAEQQTEGTAGGQAGSQAGDQAGGQGCDCVRFSMLETIREYGREQLAAAGETEQTQRRHALYYLQFAEGAAEHLQGPDQLRWLQRLDGELPNLRGALAWQPPAGAEQGAADDLLEDKLRVAGKLFLYWHLRGRYTEAITWLNALLALPGADAPTAGRAFALAAAAALKASTGDNTTVYAQGNEALAIARRLDDPRTLANALHILGTLDVALSPPDALLREDSVRHLVEAVGLRRACNDLAGTALTTDYMGFRLLRNGDYTGALPYFQEGLALGQSLQDHWTTGMALLGMAEATYLLGDVPTAQALALRSLEHHGALDDQHGCGHILGLLGDLAQAAGDQAAANEYYDESMRALRAMGEAPRNVRTLWALVTLAAATGELERALTLAGAAVTLSQTALVSPYTVDDGRLAPLWALGRLTPAEAVQTAAWQAGAAMDLTQAIAYATDQEQE